MDSITIFSTPQLSFKIRLLKRALTFGIAGGLILLSGGVWASIPFLERFGVFLFAIAIFLLGFGIFPLKKFSFLEAHPHQIKIDCTTLTFISSKKTGFNIPLKDIFKVEIINKPSIYGLKIHTQSKTFFLPYFLGDPRLNKIVHANQSN